MHLLISARNGLRRWRARRRAYDELMALDDRCLADIGIRRSEIPGLVWGPDAAEMALVSAAQKEHPEIAHRHGAKLAS